MKKLMDWLRALASGDDGREYAVWTQPHYLHAGAGRLVWPLTRREARRVAQRYVDEHPDGKAEVRVVDPRWRS